MLLLVWERKDLTIYEILLAVDQAWRGDGRDALRYRQGAAGAGARRRRNASGPAGGMESLRRMGPGRERIGQCSLYEPAGRRLARTIDGGVTQMAASGCGGHQCVLRR